LATTQRKKQSEARNDYYAETYFQELQFIDQRKRQWRKSSDQDALQVIVFWILIPIFMASISTTAIIILSMLFE